MSERKHTGGRRKFHLDEKQLIELKALASIGCTQEEIAIYFDCHRNVIGKRLQDNPAISAAMQQGTNHFKISVRRKLFALAETLPGPSIFLAKNVLGMVDVVDTRHSGSVEVENKVDLSHLDGEDLLTMRRILKKAQNGVNPEQTASASGSTPRPQVN